MVTASQVSRLLKKAGHTRSEWHGSKQVRGWGNSTQGFQVRQSHDGSIQVHHQPSTYGSRRFDAGEMVAALEKYTATLTANGYQVEQVQLGLSETALALKVTK